MPRHAPFLIALAAAAPSAAEPVDVVADIHPVAALVAAVQGDRGTVATVVTGTGDPHHVSLRPSQGRALAEADLAVWIGPALDAWFGEARDRLAPEAASLDLLDHAVIQLPRRTAEADHDDGVHHDAQDESHHDHAGDHDPHAWLAPENAVTWLDSIASTLAAIDPDGAERYRANAAAEKAKIESAAASLAAASAARPAFAYLADHDGMHYAEALAGAVFGGALSDSHATAPGPAHLTSIERRISEGDIACIVTTSGDTTRLAARVAEDNGLPLVTVDMRDSAGVDYTQWLLDFHTAFSNCAIGP